MNHHIVCLGNAVIDMSLGGTTFPILPGQHQSVDSRLITPGGMANTALCAARLGLKVTSLGNIGDDQLADLWRAPLVAEGIVVDDMLPAPSQPTTLSMVLSDRSGDHVFVSHRGEMGLPADQFPDRWKSVIQTADALYVDGWNYVSLGPEINLIASEIARRAGVPVFYDPGPWIAQIPSGWQNVMLAKSTVILLTLDEAKMAVGESLPPEQLAQKIRQRGAELVVLKQGANGILGHTAAETVFQPGLKVAVRDLTGAGDSVLAAVMLSYLEDHPLSKMMAIANATGAACVQKFGAGVNVPNKEEVLAELHKTDGRTTF